MHDIDEHTDSKVGWPRPRRRAGPVVAAVVAAVIVGIGTGFVVAHRDGGRSAATTVPAQAITTATTAPATTAAPVATTLVRPTTVSTTAVPSTGAPTTEAPAAAVAPSGFVATRAGRIELWTASGLTASAEICRLVTASTLCAVPAADVSATGLWWAELQEGGTRLRRQALAGGSAEVVTASESVISDVAVAPDERTVWFVENPGGLAAPRLRRLRGGEVSTVDERGADVEVSADGRWLAYTRYLGPQASDRLSSELVTVDLRDGTTRTYPFHGAPFGLGQLRWSPDATHLAFQKSWEGSQVGVLDLTTATSVDDARWIEGGGVSDSACWLGRDELAVSEWSTPYAEGEPKPGDIAVVNVVSGARSGLGASVWATTMACRGDGAVALVDQLEHEGDLLVLRAGRSTRLGRDYLGVYAV